MSQTKTVYFVSVLVMWVPLTFAVRRAFRGIVTEILVGGLMAVVWPFAIPVLSSITMSRRERRMVQLAPDGGVLPTTIRSSTGTDASTSAGRKSAASGSRHPRPRSPIVPEDIVMTQVAFTAN
jgi:hypothetical protein